MTKQTLLCRHGQFPVGADESRVIEQLRINVLERSSLRSGLERSERPWSRCSVGIDSIWVFDLGFNIGFCA
jgi:hypothetical protein